MYGRANNRVSSQVLRIPRKLTLHSEAAHSVVIMKIIKVNDDNSVGVGGTWSKNGLGHQIPGGPS